MVIIRFIDLELKRAFESMSGDDPIKKGLMRAFEDIENNVRVGRLVVKRAHQKKEVKRFLEKYEVNNLRIYNLPSAWRLIYSVTADEIGIIAVILDWMNHKDYERLLR